MKSLLAAVLILFFIASCQNQKPSSEKIFIDLSGRIERSNDLSPEIKKIEFFQIDGSIPIDKVRDIRMLDDQIVFLHKGGRYGGDVLGIVCIDMSGSILWNFNKEGKGPGEYEYIRFISYLSHRDEIVFQDMWNKKMHFLSTEGAHLRSIALENEYKHILELANGQLVGNTANSSRMNPEGVMQYDIVFLDDEANETEKFLPNSTREVGWYWFGETILPGVRQNIFTNTLQYTIFTISPDGVDSTWNLDFGEFNADRERYLNPAGPEDYPMAADEKEVWSFGLVHTQKNLWVLVPHFDQKIHLAIINKKDHSINYYLMPENGFYFRGIPVNPFNLTQNGDCFVLSLTALDALEKWDKLTTEEQDSSDPEWKKLMENLDPESNPIMIKLYGK